MWLAFARHFGLAMSMLSGEDEYAATGLEMPMVVGGRHLSVDEQKHIHDEMDGVIRGWADAAKAVMTEPWQAWKPWTVDGAARLDAETLDTHIPRETSELTRHVIRFHFEQDNTTPPSRQSWLGTLAQIAGGGGYAFFEDTEVFRCAGGNQSLATHLAAGLDIDRHRATNIRTGAQLFVDLAGGEREGPFDFAVVALPSVIMEKLTIDGKRFPYRAVGHGPAVKYLSGVERRSWIAEGIAPSGMSDDLGMIWEGTDNQMDTARFDISVFAGGSNAQAAIDAGGSAAYFAPRLTKVFPRYHAFATEFENWPHRAGMGYSCPAPGDVTTAQKSYASLIDGRIAVAGEHTSPPWFGYMEGALESGLVAAVRIAEQAGVAMPREWGKFRAV
jgi:monoamine oxidase